MNETQVVLSFTGDKWMIDKQVRVHMAIEEDYYYDTGFDLEFARGILAQIANPIQVEGHFEALVITGAGFDTFKEGLRCKFDSQDELFEVEYTNSTYLTCFARLNLAGTKAHKMSLVSNIGIFEFSQSIQIISAKPWIESYKQVSATEIELTLSVLETTDVKCQFTQMNSTTEAYSLVNATASVSNTTVICSLPTIDETTDTRTVKLLAYNGFFSSQSVYFTYSEVPIVQRVEHKTVFSDLVSYSIGLTLAENMNEVAVLYCEWLSSGVIVANVAGSIEGSLSGTCPFPDNFGNYSSLDLQVSFDNWTFSDVESGVIHYSP